MEREFWQVLQSLSKFISGSDWLVAGLFYEGRRPPCNVMLAKFVLQMRTNGTIYNVGLSLRLFCRATNVHCNNNVQEVLSIFM